MKRLKLRGSLVLIAACLMVCSASAGEPDGAAASQILAKLDLTQPSGPISFVRRVLPNGTVTLSGSYLDPQLGGFAVAYGSFDQNLAVGPDKPRPVFSRDGRTGVPFWETEATARTFIQQVGDQLAPSGNSVIFGLKYTFDSSLNRPFVMGRLHADVRFLFDGFAWLDRPLSNGVLVDYDCQGGKFLSAIVHMDFPLTRANCPNKLSEIQAKQAVLARYPDADLSKYEHFVGWAVAPGGDQVGVLTHMFASRDTLVRNPQTFFCESVADGRIWDVRRIRFLP